MFDAGARGSPPSLGAIRQDVRRELGHGCSLDLKVAECQRLKDRVEPPRPIEADRAELVRMLGESAEEAAESGLVGVAEALPGFEFVQVVGFDRRGQLLHVGYALLRIG